MGQKLPSVLACFTIKCSPPFWGFLAVVLVKIEIFWVDVVTHLSPHDFLMPLPILPWALFQTILCPNGDAEDNMLAGGLIAGIAYIFMWQLFKEDSLQYNFWCLFAWSLSLFLLTYLVSPM